MPDCLGTSPALQRFLPLWIWSVGTSTALSCRPVVLDPFNMLHLPQGESDITAIYLGEVTAVRDPERRTELQRCRPQGWAGQNDNTAPLLDCIATLGRTFEVELWPIEILRGAPAFPSRTPITGCLTRPPQPGAVALILQTAAGGSQLHLRKEDDPYFPWLYDAAWLQRVRDCVGDAERCAAPSALRAPGLD